MTKGLLAFVGRRRGITAILAMTAVIGSLLLYRQTEVYSPEEAAHYRHHLRAVLEINAKIDGEVLASRLNLSQSYDALSAHQKELISVGDQLLQPPGFLLKSDRDRLAQESRRLKAIVHTKLELIERFKARNAIYKSSQAFYEKNTRSLMLPSQVASETLPLEAYIHDMMLFLGDPSAANLRHVQQSRAALQVKDLEALPLSATSRQTIENLLIHGRLLEQSAQSVGELIRELLSVPVEDTQGLIDDLIGEALQNLERKTWYYRMVLYVGFILVASYLLLTFYRLNSTRLGLIQSNRELKQRYRLQKRAEQMLRLHEIAFNSAHEAIMLTDENKRIKVVNPAFERITGFTEAEVIGQDPGILKSGRHDAAFYKTMWQEIFKDGRWRGEIWNRNKDGEVYPEMLSITAVNDSQGNVSNYVAVFSDIGHIKRHETELRKMAYFDSLTGLPNRALLAERMSWAMANSKRTRSHLAACYLDLDGFKPVNDALGHDAGDQLLVELASRFKSTLRGDDTVARIGGDEFIFLFLNLASAEEAQVAVSRLLQSVSQPVRLRGEEISVSASIGVALYPDNSVDADTLIRFADQAMYEAKQKGRNRYSFFDPSKEHLTRSHHEKLNEVTQALGKGEFVLHYQPKINIRQDLVEGMEALIRWQHPERGLLLPGDFLPVIEGSEVIVDLGKWVIEQAISDMSDWLAAGLSMPVSVNVSAEQLQEKRFIEHLEQSLKKNSELPAQHLQLEILETTALDDIVSVSNLIQECHELGVSVALDDFGTGYSSLTYLKRLPASCLKIDRSFVQDITSDPESLALVRGIMGLARAFGKKAIAEGVESVEHGALLLKLGCDRVQGFAIARPMPASAVKQWLRDWQLPEQWRQLSQLHWDDEDYPLIASGIEHKRWVDRLIESISRGQPIPHANFGSYHKCNFGRWYYAPTTVQRYGQLQEFTAIDEPHREIHRIAESIDVHYRQGREDEVLSLVEKLKCYRDKVVNAVAAVERRVAQQ